MIYDLCIVGAGMFGSAAARHASANPALKVCLLGPGEPKKEQYKDRELFSSHYDEGRITRIVDDDVDCPELCKRSIERYRELEKLSDVNFYNPVGCLIISEKHDSYLKQLHQASNKYVSTVNLSCREVFHKRYPFLNMKISETALLDDNGAGHISPRKMVEAQKKVAQLQGCDIFECTVSNIEHLKNEVYQIQTEELNPSVIHAKRIVIATGAFINTKKFSILKPLNVKRKKRTVALLRISEEQASRLSSMPPLIYRGKYDEPPHQKRSAYILPPIKYPDGNVYLKIGYYGRDIEVEKLEDIKQWFLSDGDKESFDLGVQLLFDLIRGLQSEKIFSSTCVNCYTPSGLPYIDRITPTLTVAVAGNGKGAKFSDEVGRLAAKLCIDGLWDSSIPHSRFRAEFFDE